MHKNAIKKVRGGQIFRNFGQKLVFFPCFGAFYLVLFVFFWSDIRVFQEKSSDNTADCKQVFDVDFTSVWEIQVFKT